MKVLHVNGAQGYGGNEQQLLDIANKLQDLNTVNAVFCAKDSELLKRLNPYPEIKIIVAPHKKFKHRSNRDFFKQTIKEFKPDVVHLHTSNSLTLFFFADVLKHLGIPVVFSKKAMGNSMTFLSKFKYNYGGIDAIICVSQTVKEAMKLKVMFKKNHDKLYVVPDGVDEERPLHHKEGRYILEQNNKTIQIGNVANHEDKKDLLTLVKAAHYLVKHLDFTDFKIHQLGTFRDKQTPAIKNLIKELEMEDFIELYGFVENAASSYVEMDIFLMTSSREGGPSALIEAMSFKRAVVSTNVGVVPDAVINDVTGFVVPVKDYKAIAEKILILSRDAALRENFGIKGYEHFKKNFTAAQSALKTLEIYKKVINS